MDSEVKLVSGAMVALAVATAALVVMPYMEVRDIQPPPGLKPYTSAELRGRAVYIANGCVYCHTQQPRDRNFGPEAERGWGRASVPGDYVYDRPIYWAACALAPTCSISAHASPAVIGSWAIFTSRVLTFPARSCPPTLICLRLKTRLSLTRRC